MNPILIETDDPRTEWRLYVPLLGDGLRHEANLVGTYGSRTAALLAADKFVGSVLIEEVIVKTTRTVQWPGV